MRNIDICARHQCRLKDTGIEISGKQSLRSYVAEDEIGDMEPEFVEDGLELQFAQYLTDVFQKPVFMGNTVNIGGFLNSRLENTQYLSARGKMRNVIQARGLLGLARCRKYSQIGLQRSWAAARQQ